MKPEAQQMAIAEACGWKYTSLPADGGCYGWQHPTGGNLLSVACLPDYLNDLNAMHEAVSMLNKTEQRIYLDMLREILPFGDHLSLEGHIAHTNELFAFANPRADQMAVAFIRAKGKWTE